MKKSPAVLTPAPFPACSFTQLTAFESGRKWGVRNSSGKIIDPRAMPEWGNADWLHAAAK